MPVAGTLRVSLALAALIATGTIASLAVADRADAATRLVGRTFTLNQANETPRLTVICPRNKRFRFPYGGGMYSSGYEADGEGVYPHSYERLGVQHGFHVTPVLYDPSPASTKSHQVTLQVVCGKEPGRLSPKHETEFVSPPNSKTHNVRCAGRRKLIGGGFQRTDFTGKGGDFVTESYAVAPNVWRVSGTAFGTFGGELTGIGYCRRKGPSSEVSASTVISPGQVGSVTTPPCPGKKSMIWTGFTTSPLGSIFYAGGPFNPDDSVTGTGYNRSAAPATLTVEGYCNKV
jgi:hypothetical protein